MNWKCLFKGHFYEIIHLNDYKNIRGDIIGRVITSRCKVCGNITNNTVILIREFRNG